MMGRFTRDQSGMTLPLAMMMILLIGAMGAGLLVFVQTDLSSVIEVNRGQRALSIAEAGVQAAKSHLRVDSFRQHYDTNSDNDCAEGIRVGAENWSKAVQSWAPSALNPNPGECGSKINNPADDASTPWPENYGVTRTFGGGRFHVTIECFVQKDDGLLTLPNPCSGGAGNAPEDVLASERKFFKITSTGYDKTDGTGAIRKVEAIYTTAKRTYAPIAYWTPRDVKFNGTKCVKKMSFFAGRNITGVLQGDGCGNLYSSNKNFIAHRPPTTKPPLPPLDAIYGDWYAPPYNTTRRMHADGALNTKVGFGAVGLICDTSCSADSNSVADGYNDHDRTTGGVGQRKKFVVTATDPGNQITFPFDPGNAIANPSSLVDAGLLEEMRAAAAEQNTYVSTTGTHKINAANPWPGQGAIYFVDGADVSFEARSTPKAKGIIVVRNGDFSFGSQSTGFEGVIIVIGNGHLTPTGSCNVNSGTGYYTQSGSGILDGYVAASGCIEINGNVEPNTSIDYTNLNSFYDVRLWSWRELYR